MEIIHPRFAKVIKSNEGMITDLPGCGGPEIGSSLIYAA